jgi:hypothetical protein
MALDTNIRGTTGTQADVTAANELKVTGNTVVFYENDSGAATNSRIIDSPEVDDDYRLRVASETYLDQETFNYTAQNTGKHKYFNTTMTNAWTNSGMQTNSGSITTVSTGTLWQSYAFFPIHGVGSTYIGYNASFTSTCPSNTTLDFGAFVTSNPSTPATPYAPADGVYFRYLNTGLYGVINFNNTETTVGPFVQVYGGSLWTPVANQKYAFNITINERDVEFWIDNVLYGTITPPLAQGQPFISASLPKAVRHVIGATAASAAFSFILSDASVSVGGPLIADSLGVVGNRTLGSYQGLSGATMGGIQTYANSTNPTAAAPSNTALTANLPGGLGGQGNVTAAAAAVTDGIWQSYQNPISTTVTGATAFQNRRIRINGVLLDAVNLGAAVSATTATLIQFSLAFGHTAVSLATTETATSKAPRRIALGFMYWPINAVIGAPPSFGPISVSFANPIYVNPGEFIQLVGKFVLGAATASQTIQFTLTYDYGLE